MPVLKVYDERVFQPGDSSIGLVGFATVDGSLFRTYGSDGKYTNIDIIQEGLNASSVLSAAQQSSLTNEAIAVTSGRTRPADSKLFTIDAQSDDDTEPRHFRYHQDSWDRKIGHLSTGDSMAEWFAMVHLPIPMKKAMTMPNAKKAVDKEWDALANLPDGGAWIYLVFARRRKS